MPAAIASRGERKSIARPFTRTTPSSGRYSPASTFMSVLLPAPFSPSSAWISPGRKSKSTWSFASTPGNDLTIPTASRAFGDDAAWGATGSVAGIGSGADLGGRRSPDAHRSVDLGELGQFHCDAVVPPVHAGLALGAGCAWRELVKVRLLELLPRGHELLTGVVLDRAVEDDVEASGAAAQHRREGLLDLGHVLRGQVGDAGLRRLAVHEPEETHRLRVRVEVLVSGGVGLGLDLLGDPGVFGTPDPVRRRQALLDVAGARVVVRDAPLAFLLGDVGSGRGVGAREHDLRARVEQRRRAVTLLDRIVPRVDEPDVHRAFGARHLGAAHDRVAEAELLGDREGRHVAELRVAVLLRARPGQHAGEKLEVLHRTEEVAEVLAVRLVAC